MKNDFKKIEVIDLKMVDRARNKYEFIVRTVDGLFRVQSCTECPYGECHWCGNAVWERI